MARNISTKLPAINPLDERAAGVVALSQAMGRLTGAVEQMEKTSPYLIEQNKELLNSFRSASTKALDRGFSSRQYAIDQKLAKMGLGESSTAFGVQVALAREKANAYSDLELKQAELAQGLKQQSLANLHQRGDLISKNANVELNKFAAESQNKLANEQLIQHQAIAEKELEFKSEEQRLSTEFANRNMLDQRRANMASLGVNAMTNNNQQAISAQGIDNSAIAGQNAAQYQRHSLIRNPWREAANMGIGILGGKAAGALGDKMFGGETNPWSNPDSSNPSAGTMGWSKNSTKLVGNKWS